MDVTVVVATFGDPAWAIRARNAARSAERLDVRVIHEHGATLHEARNAGLAKVTSGWVCHLDADDELEPGYFDAMGAASADLRAPSVRYVGGGRPNTAGVPKVASHTHDCTADCLTDGNWLVIGTVCRAELLRSVGGWRDWPMYEDWDMWLRCWKAGATVEAVPDAVYRAHVRYDSRNRAPSREAKEATHRAILEACR